MGFRTICVGGSPPTGYRITGHFSTFYCDMSSVGV